jgi:3-oxoacyl-[acyl-carrier protein] reductase
MEGFAVYGGSKTPANYLVEVLAKEIGYRGVTVNSIVPFAVEGSGMFTGVDTSSESMQWIRDLNPMKRLAKVEDVANVAEFFASELSSFVSGQHLIVNGGAKQ